MNSGEELVEQPFQRLVEQKLLMAYPHDGVFLTMDTYKETQTLDDMYVRGEMPWKVWSGDDSPPVAEQPIQAGFVEPSLEAR